MILRCDVGQLGAAVAMTLEIVGSDARKEARKPAVHVCLFLAV